MIGPGFIGWNVLELLVDEGYSVCAMVRRKEHGEGIKKSGGLVILGDLNNHELIAKHVVENDVGHDFASLLSSLRQWRTLTCDGIG